MQSYFIQFYAETRQLIDKDIIRNPQIIGENLKILRISKEMTVEYAASSGGISKSFLSLAESGKRRIKTAELRKLLSVYGYSYGRFLSEVIFDEEYRNDPKLIKECNIELESRSGKYKMVLTDAVFEKDETENLELFLAGRSETPEFKLPQFRLKGKVLEGRLLIQFHDDEFEIDEGMDFEAELNKPFIFRNYKKKECRAVFISTPAVF